jgi:hypothetical protein
VTAFHRVGGVTILHDGWVHREPVLSGAGRREFEAAVSALRKLKRERDLPIEQRAAINAALVRAHEAHTDAAARDALSRMRALVAAYESEHASAPARSSQVLEQPAPAIAASASAPFVLSAALSTPPSTPLRARRRAA